MLNFLPRFFCLSHSVNQILLVTVDLLKCRASGCQSLFCLPSMHHLYFFTLV